jgi:hypothetical protein
MIMHPAKSITSVMERLKGSCSTMWAVVKVKNVEGFPSGEGVDNDELEPKDELVPKTGLLTDGS